MGFAVTSEVKPGDRIADITRVHTSSGAVVGDPGDPKSGQRKAKVPKRRRINGRRYLDRASDVKKWGGYLVYHINKGLGIVPTEITDHLNLTLAHQGCLDQRDDFAWEEGTTS